MWHFRTRRGCRWTIIRCGTYAFSIASESHPFIYIYRIIIVQLSKAIREKWFSMARDPLVLLMPTDVPSRAGIRFDVKEMDAFRLKASEDVASESSFLF